jgi:hypothetical protein
MVKFCLKKKKKKFKQQSSHTCAGRPIAQALKTELSFHKLDLHPTL